MNQRALEAKEQAIREAQFATMPKPPDSSIPQVPIPSSTTGNPMPDISSSNSTSQTSRRMDPAASLDDEEGKRNLISSEIQMFRDRFKDEDTKMRNTEKERKDRYERERALQREKRVAEETVTSGNNKSAVSPTTPPSRDRSSPSRREHTSSTSRRDRSSPSDDRYRSSSSRNNTSNSVRSRTGDRRSSPPPRYDRRSPVPSSSSRPYPRRSRTKSPVSKNHPTNEDDEETYERKKQERRLRDKELRYREVN
jgi:hypothetical protein